MADTKNNYSAVGRRKTSSARVRLWTGKDGIVVNGKPITEYFPGPVSESQYMRPFSAVGMTEPLSGSVIVAGGGQYSQLGAVVHGIARALVKLNPEYKLSLRKMSLLTRDPRMKESRKYGNAQKARAKKSSPKR